MLLLALNRVTLLAVVAISLLNGAMHGVSFMITSMLPLLYKKTGKVSTVSGLLNSFVYIGSAISSYGVAAITENFGWNVTVAVWLALAFLGATICFGCRKFSVK